ncbi:MAG: hypothetical protein ACQKBU_01990 [Verrucomicrobiales bacterium]
MFLLLGTFLPVDSVRSEELFQIDQFEEVEVVVESLSYHIKGYIFFHDDSAIIALVGMPGFTQGHLLLDIFYDEERLLDEVEVRNVDLGLVLLTITDDRGELAESFLAHKERVIRNAFSDNYPKKKWFFISIKDVGPALDLRESVMPSDGFENTSGLDLRGTPRGADAKSKDP